MPNLTEKQSLAVNKSNTNIIVSAGAGSGKTTVLKTRVENYGEGVKIYMEVSIVYGFNVKEGINAFKEKSKKEIEKLTAMNVVELDVVAKNIYVPQNEEEIGE